MTRTAMNIDPLNVLRRAFDTWMDDYPVFGPLARTRVYPPLNVWDDENNFYVEAELPGVKSDDLEISAQGNELTIKGKREAVQEEDVTVHRKERSSGQFTRGLTLPAEVDADKVNASLKEGVLTITLPKSESAKKKKIEVKAGE